MRVVYLLLTAIHFVKKQTRGPLFSIAFLKCSKPNYQADRVLENFKYSFHFDGITLTHERTLTVPTAVCKRRGLSVLRTQGITCMLLLALD